MKCPACQHEFSSLATGKKACPGCGAVFTGKQFRAAMFEGRDRVEAAFRELLCNHIPGGYSVDIKGLLIKEVPISIQARILRSANH